MAAWADLFDNYLKKLLDGLDGEAVLARYGWVEEYSRMASELLSPANLSAMPPHEIYAALDALNVPKCQVRMTNLGRMNDAGEVVEGITALLAKPGDFAAKYRAGKIPQAGTVALSQILSLARPDRFAIRNTPLTRALAKQIPLYTAKALDELGYEEFLDICRELTRVMEARFKRLGLGEWANRYRFLLLYALLVVPVA
ncbi:MAG: hypothetical protein LUC93_12130 [Planctomycetaceae bacterium]|nr:hypothetical protein [Planctomycetaceae bacterium]